MSVSVNWAGNVTVTEIPDNNTGALSATQRRLKFDGYNRAGVLTATTSPPATKAALFALTLTAGAGTIDLAALTGLNGVAVDGTGLRVQLFAFKNTGANNMVITPGASNGIDLFGAGSSITVPPGGHFLFNLNDAGPDIASGDRTLDVAGTGSQAAEVTVILG